MITLHAEHDGVRDLPLGEFTTLQDATEYIQDQEAGDEYWMEGCDLVAYDDAGEMWVYMDGDWEILGELDVG